jgi:tetratricopeptide (TPR) repeat protein
MIKKLHLLLLIIFTSSNLFAATALSDSSQITAHTIPLDTLKQRLTQLPNDSLKGGIYMQMAGNFMRYDTVKSAKEKLSYQTQALTYTFSAIHAYSKYNDTVGMRNAFDNLARVYHDQKKYSQAKWYILQSNTVSRSMKDVPNIIASLTELSKIKADIKDYQLALSDLHEAINLSSTNHLSKTQADIELNLAMLYARMKDYKNEEIAMKRHDAILDSMQKVQLAQVAKAAAQDSALSKKKLHLVAYKKSSKALSSKRLASI